MLCEHCGKPRIPVFAQHYIIGSVCPEIKRLGKPINGFQSVTIQVNEKGEPFVKAWVRSIEVQDG